jgi:hypothetical protein
LAGEVLWIGDSWAAYPSMQARVAELAQAAGAIGTDETYSTNAAIGGLYLSDIVRQYETRQAGATKVKVILMDGGTWDTVQLGTSDDVIARVVQTFLDFTAQVHSDGTVEHIVYWMVPDLPAIQGEDILRPLFSDMCGGSQVPCHYLDLQRVWEGHPEYTGPSMIQASVAGQIAIANEIWEIMQQNCIAQ